MKLKQQDLILSDAESLAAEGTAQALMAQIDATLDLAEATDIMSEARLKNIRATLEQRKVSKDLDSDFDVDAYISGIQHQLDAVEFASQTAIDNIQNSLSAAGNTAKADAEDALEKLTKQYTAAMNYWENRLGANQSRMDQVNNEIDLMQKQGKTAGEDFYKEQLKLENERLSLLNQQKEEAKRYLSQFREGTDEWFV